MRNAIFFILFLFLSAIGFSQEKIEWREERPLSWNDFKAEADSEISYTANTNSGISYSWNYSTATGEPILEHEVHAFFYPEKSWVKTAEMEDYLLAHEQLHFDISELHARKLRKAIENYEIGRTIRQDLKRIYNQIEKERLNMQNLFDEDTSHSENKEAEMKWRRFVQEELKKLSRYSN